MSQNLLSAAVVIGALRVLTLNACLLMLSADNRFKQVGFNDEPTLDSNCLTH